MPSCIICTETLGSRSPNDIEFFQVERELVVDNDGRSKVSTTSCGHLFHTSCIAKWIQTPTSRKKCPICNKEIAIGSITTIFVDWSINDNEALVITGNNVCHDSDYETIVNERKMLIQENLAYKIQLNEIKKESFRYQQQNTKLREEMKLLKEKYSKIDNQLKEKINEVGIKAQKVETLQKNTSVLNNKNRLLQLKLEKYKYSQQILAFESVLPFQKDKINACLKLDENQRIELYLASEMARNDLIQKLDTIKELLQDSLNQNIKMKSIHENTLKELMEYKKKDKECSLCNERAKIDLLKNPFIKVTKRNEPLNTNLSDPVRLSEPKLHKRLKSIETVFKKESMFVKKK